MSNLWGWWAGEQRKNLFVRIEREWGAKDHEIIRVLWILKFKEILKIELLIMYLIVKLLIVKW